MSIHSVRSIDHEIGVDGLFQLHVRSGDVRLRGVAGAAVRVRTADPDDLARLTVERGSGSLSIRAHSGSPDLDIEIPIAASVVVEGASADLTVTGLHGEQRYRTASGDLEVREGRGGMTAEAVSGDVDVVTDGPSSITARTVSGDVEVRAGLLASLRATTTSGDLRIAGRFEGPGPFGLETVSGDATLAPANDIRVDVSTITGDIASDIPSRLVGERGSRALVVGAGGPTLTFRSTSGDLRVVRASSLPLAAPVAAMAPPAPEAPIPPAPSTDVEDPRLDTLRALERGEIDIEEAGRRLEAFDDAGRNAIALPAAAAQEPPRG